MKDISIFEDESKVGSDFAFGLNSNNSISEFLDLFPQARLGSQIDQTQTPPTPTNQLPRRRIARRKPKKSKITKQKKRNQSTRQRSENSRSDYRKNICGYIIKKIIRQLSNPSYSTIVNRLCLQEGASYSEVTNFYELKKQSVTGPSHLHSLFSPSTSHEFRIMRVFLCFFKWFLSERYVRHAMIEGKMSQKKSYIEYKNRVLVPLVQQFEARLLGDGYLVSVVSEQTTDL